MQKAADLKAALWEPQTRLSEKNLRDLEQDIAQAGILQPILVQPDGTIIDGHRRVLCALKLGIAKVPTIICRRPPREAFRAINDTTRKLSSRENLELYLAGGLPARWAARDIAKLRAFGGSELLQAIYDNHQSPSILKVIGQVARYCSCQDEPDMMQRIAYWLLKHRMQRNARYACDSGTLPEVIYAAILRDQPLIIRVVSVQSARFRPTSGETSSLVQHGPAEE